MDPNPSDLLAQITAQSSPEFVLKSLEKHLYPALDELSPEPRNIILEKLQAALRDSERSRRLVESIAFESRKKKLEASLKELEKDIKNRSWANESQSEEICDIGSEIVRWLPTLWRVGVEEGSEVQHVQECLVFCTNISRRLAECDARVSGCYDFELFGMEIETSNGKTLVPGDALHPLLHSVTWVWRDLWISASSSRSPFATSIGETIVRLKLRDKVLNITRKDGETSYVAENPDGYQYYDAHWTPAMRTAASIFLNARQHARIATFEKDLSSTVYTQLIKSSPNLKPSLIYILRTHVLDTARNSNLPYSVFEFAANIFLENSPPDLISLRDALPASQRDTCMAVPIIVKHLSTHSSPERRAEGLRMIKEGLEKARQDVFDDMEATFIGWPEAVGYLQEQVDEGRLSRKAPTNKNLGPEYRERNRLLHEFVEDAVLDDDPHERFGDWLDDEDDHTCPNLARPFKVWATALCAWPRKEEAESVWDSVKSPEDDTNLVLGVDGVAKALSDRCDTDYNGRPANQYLADGIRAMYNALRCKDTVDLGRKLSNLSRN